MKKIVIIIIFAALVAALLPTLAACKDDTVGPVKLPDDIVLPDNLAEGQLDFEWVTSIHRSRSTAVILDGIQTNPSARTELALDATVYTKTVFESSVLPVSSLVDYWTTLGFNVCIYHYETFALTEESTLTDRILSKDSYAADLKVNYSLAEVFAVAWAKYAEASFANLDYVNEVRFVGNNAGATLALAAADYLWRAYANGVVAEYVPPTRVAICEPDLEDKHGFNTEAAVSYLAGCGVVLEMYSHKIENITEFSEVLAQNTAYFFIRESYTSYISESYLALNRIAFDWYLYSARGSETLFSGTPNKGYGDSNPIIDRRDNYYQDSYVRYGASAWTPTVYMRALRGISFEPKDVKSNQETNYVYVYYARTLTRFSNEVKMCSNNLDKAVLAGYIFDDKNDDGVFNDGISSGLKNVELIIKITVDYTNNVFEYKYVRSDAHGFYSVQFEDEYVNKNFDLSVVTPSSKYTIGLTVPSDLSAYRKISCSTLTSENTYQTLSLSSGQTMAIIKNCAFVQTNER